MIFISLGKTGSSKTMPEQISPRYFSYFKKSVYYQNQLRLLGVRKYVSRLFFSENFLILPRRRFDG
jgi:hypothetical protein